MKAALPQSNERKNIRTALVFVAGVGLEIFDWVHRLDFILSFSDEKARWWFEIIFHYFTIAIVILILIVIIRFNKNQRLSNVQVGLVVGILAFLWGGLLGVYCARSSPLLLAAYGRHGPVCNATIDTAPLAHLKEQYDVALACRFQDNRIEAFDDDRITVSTAFRITGENVTIDAPFSPKMMVVASNIAEQPGNAFSFATWFAPIIIPKGTDTTKITRLSDVEHLGGRVLAPRANSESYTHP
jgi:hypothetical protein